MNLNALMKQAQSMQKDMMKPQEEVGKMVFSAKQPLVEVEVNGNTEIVSIKINKDISLDDMEMLEDMILLATNEAIKKAKNEMEQRLSKYGQGIPGLF
jgi:hypothetical protein